MIVCKLRHIHKGVRFLIAPQKKKTREQCGRYTPARVNPINIDTTYYKDKSSPVTGLEWPRRFHEVKVPRYRDNGTG